MVSEGAGFPALVHRNHKNPYRNHADELMSNLYSNKPTHINAENVSERLFGTKMENVPTAYFVFGRRSKEDGRELKLTENHSDSNLYEYHVIHTAKMLNKVHGQEKSPRDETCGCGVQKHIIIKLFNILLRSFNCSTLSADSARYHARLR